MATKKTVFLTGSSGNMGWHGFLELYKHTDEYDIVLLNRGSKKNRDMFHPYENDPSVKLLWGDLTNYEDVLSGISGSDIVLHVGGLVSPAADYLPKATMHTNVTAAQNIVNAINAQPNPDAIKVVYIGTVAQTGDRNAPIHWGRTGDPIKISVYDHYAISKTIAERIFAESGLKYWGSLRQSGILYPAVFRNFDPIMYHLTLCGVLEWATIDDSARLLLNVCKDDVPNEFWRRFYNIGSGKEYRLTNFEFLTLMLGELGIKDVRKVFNPEWFITQNFHGQWYSDSDLLESYLHFRKHIPVHEYFHAMSKSIPRYMKLAGIIPPALLRHTMMKSKTTVPGFGTMDWIKNNNEPRIKAYFGSIEKWRNLKDWENINTARPTEKITYLNHGYDENKPESEIDISDMKYAAEFRGGKCLSKTMIKGDLHTPLEWECAFSHKFSMSPNLILKGGHWCPKELPIPWNYDEEAKRNPFFAQVWHIHHEINENNFFDNSIYKDFEEE